jgi:hypothetical protein
MNPVFITILFGVVGFLIQLVVAVWMAGRNQGHIDAQTEEVKDLRTRLLRLQLDHSNLAIYVKTKNGNAAQILGNQQ